MMRSVEKSGKTVPPAPIPLAMSAAQVLVALEQHCFLLDDGKVARQAVSCLITPEVGDHVLTTASGEDGAFILHILTRSQSEQAQLAVPGVHQLTLRQPQLCLSADDKLALLALNNLELCAATGLMQLNANNLFMTVNDSLVANARHLITQVEQYLLEARQLLRLSGQQALITAERDIKIDGERISVG